MNYFDKYLKSRVGTCRSGIPFDVPHDFSDVLAAAYLIRFNVQDQVDIFCMCEAVVIEQLKDYKDRDGIIALEEYFWQDEIIAILKPHLEQLGLKTSPDYVRFGIAMLLR